MIATRNADRIAIATRRDAKALAELFARARAAMPHIAWYAGAEPPPDDAPGDDCPDHGPYGGDDCPKS